MKYVSCSWDQTIRVWNAWKKPKRRLIPKNDNKGMVLNSGVGDNKPSTAGSEKKVAFSDVDGDEEMAKIPEEDEDLHTEA